MTRTAFFAAVVACAFFTREAEATPAAETSMTLLVNYTDSDLDTKAGQASLKRKIRWAAARACTVGGDLQSDCYTAAVRNAVMQMNEKVIAREAKRANGSAAIATQPDSRLQK
jgi:UrcA family protein